MTLELKKEIIEEYLKRCRVCCGRGYTRLYEGRESINQILIGQYGTNGNRKTAEKIVRVLDEVTFDFLDKIMGRASTRTFGWPDFYEQELREKLSIALQEA